MTTLGNESTGGLDSFPPRLGANSGVPSKSELVADNPVKAISGWAEISFQVKIGMGKKGIVTETVCEGR
jgi:hypothetical protein